LTQPVHKDPQPEQPLLIYDLAYKAQLDCIKNRSGGRVNQGIIELLVPIVTAQLLFDQDYSQDGDYVSEKAVQVLKNTSYSDVCELVKMKRLANDLSSHKGRKVPEYDVDNVFDYYQMDFENSRSLTAKRHNEEFIQGFPTIRQIYKSISESEKHDFGSRVEDAYKEARLARHARIGNSSVGTGLTADCIAVGIYLTLSHNPQTRIIK